MDCTRIEIFIDKSIQPLKNKDSTTVDKMHIKVSSA